MAEYSNPRDAIRSPQKRVTRPRWNTVNIPSETLTDEDADARVPQDIRGDLLNPLDLLAGGPSQAMFLGATAKMAPLARIKQALELKAAGVPERDIYFATQGPRGEPGISFGKDGKPRWEIEDYMSIPPGVRGMIASIMDTGQSVSAPLRSFITDKELHANYPTLGSVRSSFTPKSSGTIGGQANVNPSRLDESSIELIGDPMKLRRGLSHEIQHVIQAIEKHARGGNPEYVAERTYQEIAKPKVNRYTRFRDAVDNSPADLQTKMRIMNTPTYKRLSQEAYNWTSKLFDPYEKERLYARLAGEVEARNTEKRLDLDLLTRALLHPEETADVPRKLQIVDYSRM